MIQGRKYIKVGQRKRPLQKIVVQEQEEANFDIYDEEIEEISDGFKRLSVSPQDEEEEFNKKSRQGELKNFDLTLLPHPQKVFSKCEQEIQQNYDNEQEIEYQQTVSTSDENQDEVLYYQCNEINYVEDLNLEKNSVKSKKVQMKKNQKSINNGGLKRKIFKQKI